ncbi:YerC/YecD family TrpR-related protein [Sphingomonas arenae]|uniref:YerC/YecD family TrpR-related protein n=1 Tax=Sphingomonas arenae TaxID=2812555 RepID=UPI00196877D2|nr:YerC/YecD family TrpR-related protein [Sphingomonas arenae]
MATAATILQPTRDEQQLCEDLCRALLTPESPEEMRRLLVDLCTPAEIRTLAERWHVARLLDGTDLSYRDIHDSTGVSTTTIVRIARFLRQEPHQGYRRAIDTLEGDNAG